MAIDVNCPECAEPMRFPDRAAGKVVRCPNCEAKVLIPDEPAMPQIAAAPSPSPGARASARPPAAARTPLTQPLVLASVAAVLVLGLFAGIVFSLSGWRQGEPAPQVARAADAKPKPASDLEEDVLLLDEDGKPIRQPKPKPEKPAETPVEKPAEKPGEKPAEKPAEKPVAEPPAPEKPEEPKPEPSPEPAPVDPEPEDAMPPVAPPADPAPSEPEPEPTPVPEPVPVPPAPPEQDHTKVDVIKLLPTPKPEPKPAPADPKAKSSGKEKSPGKSKTRPKRPQDEDQVPEVMAGPPDPACATCRGLGKVPFSPFRPYVAIEGMAAPKPDLLLPGRYCPKCQKGKDDKDGLEAEAARLKTGQEKHAAWEQKTTWQLVLVQTHLASIHAQLPPPEARNVGVAVEALAKHLEDVTGSLELCVTRPDDCELIILWEKQNYLRFLKLMEPEWGAGMGNNWALLPELAGSTVGPTSFFRQLEKGSPPPAHMAVSMLAKQQLARATGGRVPEWLREGFGAYGENAVLGKNLVHSIDYQIQNHQLNPDWSIEMRRLAATNQLRSWARMFILPLRDYGPPDYVTSFSMTAFLLRTEPQKFLDLVRALRDGKDSPTALAECYGKPVEQLQQAWLQWVVAPR